MVVVTNLYEMSPHTVHILPVKGGFTWVRRARNNKDVKEAGQTFKRRYNAQRSAVNNNGDIWRENVWDHYPAGTKFKCRSTLVQKLNSKNDYILQA